MKLVDDGVAAQHGHVAPYTGAWIETSARCACRSRPTGSHPTRVRGLKPDTDERVLQDLTVAPHAGAWIETTCPAPEGKRCACRTPHRCVIEMGRLERSCKPACHDAPLRIHDLKLPAKEYPKAGLKQKSPHGDFRKGFCFFLELVKGLEPITC